MSVMTDAQSRPVFDQKWDMQVLQARYADAVIMPRVRNSSSEVEESGEIVNITTKPRIVGGDVGADGGFTSEQITLSNIQINVNIWKYVSVEVTDKQAKQAIVTLQNELSKQYGARLQEFTEIDLANQFLNFTGGSSQLSAGVGIGTPGSGVTFLEPTALTAVKLARQKQLPMDDMSWILSVESFYGDGAWLSKERLTNANTTGHQKALMETGVGYGKNFKQMILGIPAYECTLLNGATTINIDTLARLNGPTGINVDGTTACALLHKEALGVVVQINNKTEIYRTTPAGRFATAVSGNTLYGVKSLRANHGILFYVSNA